MLKEIDEFIKKDDDVEQKTFETFSRISKENSMPKYNVMPKEHESESSCEEE